MANPKVSDLPNQEQLADMIGISVDTLHNYKKLTELVPVASIWTQLGKEILWVGNNRKSDINNFNLKYPDAPKAEKELADRLGITF